MERAVADRDRLHDGYKQLHAQHAAKLKQVERTLSLCAPIATRALAADMITSV